MCLPPQGYDIITTVHNYNIQRYFVSLSLSYSKLHVAYKAEYQVYPSRKKSKKEVGR